MFLRVFQLFLRMLVNVSWWCMEIGNFNESISNFLCYYVFYLSNRLMVIDYILYAVLFKHIVNWALVLAIFNTYFRKKVNIINIYIGCILYWNVFFSIHLEHGVLQVLTTAEWWYWVEPLGPVLNLILAKVCRSVIEI